MPLRKVIPSIPRGRPRASVSCLGAAAVLSALCACDPTVIIGARAGSDSGGADSTVPNAGDDGAAADGALADAGASDGPVCATPGAAAGAVPDADVPVSAPWTTGFEDGFCDYAFPMGFCFATGGGAYTVVTSPVHSGQHAAAFSVQGTLDAGGSQARCVQQGVFPGAAYYGAWYYVPASARNNLVWNLFHYQGGVPGQPLHGLWDVSLVNVGDGGALHVTFFDFLNGSTPNSNAAPPIPLGQWFHLEVYFKRASDATGELSLWQDGVLAVHLTGLATDNTDFGQWYVGNYASDLVPPASTIYVDDVTIGFTP
jgi:hypothetical protein